MSCMFHSVQLQTSELGVTEHVEGDPCKFALWVGRTPTSDNKIVLKVNLSLSFSLKAWHCFASASYFAFLLKIQF